VPGGVCNWRFGGDLLFSDILLTGWHTPGIMESGLGIGDDLWNNHQYYFGNFNPMETARAQGGLSHCDRNESDFNDFDGVGHEPGGLWNDGGTRNHPGCFTSHFGGRIFGCLAL